MIDLDYFKRINDRYGHDGGDQVLCGFVERTRALLPDDAVFSRMGGEEFVVLLPERTMLEARLIANQICLSFRREAVRIDSGEVDLTTSIGVGHLAHDEPLEVAMKRADLALYEAKKTGRDQVRYSAPNGSEQVATLA